jgi:DNA-binding winged helix-turn-helix (wHTH) protein
MAHGINRLYEFGPYKVDQQKLQLWRHGSPVPLPPKAAEILLVLLARSGETVSKEELMLAVWPDSYVEESNLTQNIFLLRKALGETAQDNGTIITIPGKGYRLVAEVRQVSDGEAAPGAMAADELPANPEQLAAAPAGRPAAGRLRWLWLLAPGLVLIALIAALVWHRQQQARPQAPPERVMLAVLPFENLTGDPGQEYFSDGMTEEMIAQLGNLDPQHLGVIARTSVMHYKNGKTPLDQIGRELGVQYVLDDLPPCIRTEVSMIFGFRGGRYGQEQAHGGADHRCAEAGGGRAHGRGCGPGVRRQRGDHLRMEGEVRRHGRQRGAAAACAGG